MSSAIQNLSHIIFILHCSSRNCQVSGRARNHVTKIQVDEVVHLFNHNEYGSVNNMVKVDGDEALNSGASIGTITGTTDMQGRPMSIVDGEQSIKTATTGGDQPMSPSMTTSSTVDYVR